MRWTVSDRYTDSGGSVMKKVMVTSRSFGKTSDISLNMLKNAGWTIDYMIKDFDQAAFERAIPEYQALIIGAHPFPPSLFEKCPNLKIICKHGVGLDNIPLEAAKQNGVIVTNAPGTNSNAVADFTVLLMLACARNLIYSVNELKKRNFTPNIGVDVCNKKLGLLGFGNIARRVAKRANGFDMEISAFDPYVKTVPEDLSYVKLVSFNEILKESDFICVHLPLTDETKGMIGKAEFEKMKKSARLIDTARGGLVDEKALFEAVHDGKIAGAALDVTESEPIEADNPLLTLPQVIITNHVASYSKEALDAISIMCADGVIRASEGHEVVNRVV